MKHFNNFLCNPSCFDPIEVDFLHDRVIFDDGWQSLMQHNLALWKLEGSVGQQLAIGIGLCP